MRVRPLEAFTKTIGSLSCVFVVGEKKLVGCFGLDDDRGRVGTRRVSSES
jgi:hypothetical protein